MKNGEFLCHCWCFSAATPTMRKSDACDDDMLLVVLAGANLNTNNCYKVLM
jgi:hypothetical protein